MPAPAFACRQSNRKSRRKPIGGSKFPARSDKIPVSMGNFPVPRRREIGSKVQEDQGIAPRARARFGRNSQEFPVFSLITGNSLRRRVRSRLPAPPAGLLSLEKLSEGLKCRHEWRRPAGLPCWRPRQRDRENAARRSCPSMGGRIGRSRDQGPDPSLGLVCGAGGSVLDFEKRTSSPGEAEQIVSTDQTNPSATAH